MLVDADEITEWERYHPQPYDRDAYQGAYHDPHGTPESLTSIRIQEMAANGLDRTSGTTAPSDAMGVPRDQLPAWDSSRS